jgi:hypothetical protein
MRAQGRALLLLGYLLLVLKSSKGINFLFKLLSQEKNAL